MALFEFEDGQLIPAQFGRTVAGGITGDILDAVRAQVLEIVSRPLFPITWNDLSRLSDGAAAGADQPRLTALDASGQVVSVEVVAHLDSDTLIASLSRLADTAGLSWSDLAREYPGNVEGFKAGWTHFRDSMPPSAASGPRLVMVVGSIDPQVRPALDVLAASGVEVHEITLRQMSNGRAFLEVHTVGPRLYGHVPQVLVGTTAELAAITAPEPSDTQTSSPQLRPVAQPAPAPQTAQARPSKPSALPLAEPSLAEPEQEPPRALTTQASQSAQTPAPTTTPQPQNSADRATPPRPRPAEAPKPDTVTHPQVETLDAPTGDNGADPVAQANAAADAAVVSGRDRAPIDVQRAQELGVPLLVRDVHGLQALAAILGRDVPLAVRQSLDPYLTATLSPDGRIAVRGQALSDPTDALVASGITGLDGWEEWHLGDRLGPSLAESLDEVNREMMREYERAGHRQEASHRH